jgi:hypothetical protein
VAARHFFERNGDVAFIDGSAWFPLSDGHDPVIRIVNNQLIYGYRGYIAVFRKINRCVTGSNAATSIR